MFKDAVRRLLRQTTLRTRHHSPLSFDQRQSRLRAPFNDARTSLLPPKIRCACNNK